ncbi:hypothetical protein [Pseudomonas batumici]|uniref:Uncharacterized protein n=1 Tax=Pseudomonas batumici TaxID=226910 RepID=A0A0C2I315_9PSED|nr:hypothetical protein [Pseudomonas batumici]KIH83611.1 hypothetical protein UCMB321_2737 [Pseudomonas batumici]
MINNKFHRQVGAVFALFMCGMISLHGGITLFYLSMTSIDFTSQEILTFYLSGCLTVVLIPLMGASCERVVQVALVAKILLVLCVLSTGIVWIIPEALCSGLIASSSFYFAMREVSKGAHGKLLASVLVLIINIESLVWYAALGWLSELQSRVWLSLAYGLATILPLLYLSTFVGTAMTQRVSIKQLLVLGKSLSVYNLCCYMLAAFAANCFNLSLHHWAELDAQRWWGSVPGITGFYILGVLACVVLLSRLKVRDEKLLVVALLGLCAIGYWLAGNATEDSLLLAAAVFGLGSTSTLVMSSIVADLAQTHDTLSRLLVVAVLAAMQVCLISLIHIVKVFAHIAINEWQAIAIAGGALILFKVRRLYVEGFKLKPQ